MSVHCGVKPQAVRQTENKTRHACMKAAEFNGFHRAKPVSETERSGVERALQGKLRIRKVL